MNIISKTFSVLLLSCLSFLFCSSSLARRVYVTHEKSSQLLGITELKIVLHVDDQQIGCVYCTKVFGLLYVLHTLYIAPEYRCQGYGTKLGLYACEVAKKMGAKKIYIQPGPFELDNNKEISYKENLAKLIAFYKKRGFSIAPKFISKCAFLLYKIIGINEDPAYLMLKNL